MSAQDIYNILKYVHIDSNKITELLDVDIPSVVIVPLYNIELYWSTTNVFLYSCHLKSFGYQSLCRSKSLSV